MERRAGGGRERRAGTIRETNRWERGPTAAEERLTSEDSATRETERVWIEPHASHERQARPRLEACQDIRSHSPHRLGAEIAPAGTAPCTAAPAFVSPAAALLLRIRYCFVPERDAGAEPASVRSAAGRTSMTVATFLPSCAS
jgi:hypothetical protein